MRTPFSKHLRAWAAQKRAALYKPGVEMTIHRFNNRAGLMNPESNGLYVRYEDHCALATSKAEPAASEPCKECNGDGWVPIAISESNPKGSAACDLCTPKAEPGDSDLAYWAEIREAIDQTEKHRQIRAALEIWNPHHEGDDRETLRRIAAIMTQFREPKESK